MKLLIYAETYGVGGSERFLADLIEQLDHERHEVLLAGNPHEELDRWLETRAPHALPRLEVPIEYEHHSRVLRLGAGIRQALAGGDGGGSLGDRTPREPPPSSPLHRRLVRAGVRRRQASVNYGRLKRLFREVRPDVLHINNGGYPGAESCRVASIAAKAEGVPGVVHFVHGYAWQLGWPRARERRLDRRVAEATDTWVTVAEGARRALHERRAIPLEDIRTVHLGQAIPDRVGAHREALRHELGIPKGLPVLALISSIDGQKGHRDLIEAMAQLSADGVRTAALLAGTGPERQALERRAAGLGIAEDVRFLGWLDDVAPVLDAADLLVQPSVVTEAMPYTIKEAMAHALPVVATRVGGIPELVADGVTGQLVPPHDPAALAAAIGRLARDPSRAAEMGLAGRRLLEREMTMERMVRDIEAIYAEALR